MRDRYDAMLIGGSGIIGTHLAAFLLERGESILNVSRHEPERSLSGVDFFGLDFARAEDVVSFSFPRAEAVIILIGQTGPKFDPKTDRQALEAIVKKINSQQEPIKVMYCSTALVYGNSDRPSRESNPTSPIEDYARHKAENEAFLANQLAPQHHLAILRLSNVFGDIRSRGFVSLVMNRLLEPSTEKFLINGDGLQERDYIYIQDLVEAIAAVKERMEGRAPINISSGESRSLLSVLQAVQEISGKELSFLVTHKPVKEAVAVHVSCEQLSRLYGYTPRHTFEEGVSLMWKAASHGKSSWRIL